MRAYRPRSLCGGVRPRRRCVPDQGARRARAAASESPAAPAAQAVRGDSPRIDLWSRDIFFGRERIDAEIEKSNPCFCLLPRGNSELLHVFEKLLQTVKLVEEGEQFVI